MIETQKLTQADEEATLRRIQRKPSMPQANARNYDKENVRMGVKNAVDLVLSQLQGQNEDEVQHKFHNELIKFSQDQEDKVSKAKEPKYLTVKGLLDHPYFI